MRPSPDSATRGPTPCRGASCQIGRTIALSWSRCWMRWRIASRFFGSRPPACSLKRLIDVAVSPLGVGAVRDREGLDARGRVAEDAAQSIDDALQLFFLIRRG